MPTVETAAIAACVFAGLFAGHQIGDHPVQRRSAMLAKGTPDDVRLAAGAHPWAGWRACGQHVATYTFTQAAALVLVSVVAPLTLTGGLAALAVSASTHAVIDRRWIVHAIIRAKQCQDWPEGPYLIGQSLHHGALLVAAVVAAAVTTVSALAIATAVCVALVAADLAVERRRAGSAADRIGDPHRL